MAIQVGQRLGPYEILSAIGAGGMGEVYQAHDIKLGRDVAIKVLPEACASDPSNSPTLSLAATMHGVILGTAAYMSPEQARGKAVDKRTDIWAFGCVLYELLTGKQAFEGQDITEIVAAVVKSEPYWQVLPSATPAQIRNLLRRCLQKDKAMRLQAAGDARIEIQEGLTAPTPAEPTATRSASFWRQAAMLAIGGLAFFDIGGIAVWKLLRANRVASVARR